MNKIFYILFSMLSINAIWAQKNINGKITNTENKAIQNAYIQEINGNNAVYSDTEGNFSITLKEKSNSIRISHINYITQILEISNNKIIDIKLQEAPTQIDNVIIIRNNEGNIAQTNVVTDEMKKSSQVRNTADLFNDIPGFSMQKRSATALEPSFRSFKYEEMNIKYDGGAKTVHACPNRMDPITAHIIPEEVQKIEVVKGPYTVRYGQRFGATVNLVSDDYSHMKKGFSGVAEGGYESNGNNILGRFALNYKHKVFDVVANVETRHFGDYKDGRDTLTPASFKTNSYSIKLGFNPSKKHRLLVSWRQKWGRDIKHAGLPMDSPKDDSYALGLDYKFNKISEVLKSVAFKIYASKVDHTMNNFDRPNFMMMAMQTPVQSQTLGGKIEATIIPHKKMILFAGLDADIIDRDGTKMMTMKRNMMGNPIAMPMTMKSSVWQNAIIQDYGLFAEGTYQIIPKLSTTIGLRGDFVTGATRAPNKQFAQLYNGEVKDQFHFTFGANASLKYKHKGWQAQFVYGRGTRTPNMIERYIYKFTVGQDPFPYIGNPNLKPEINNQFELSFSKKMKKMTFGANAFYSIFQNYITAKVNPDFKYMHMMKMVMPKQFVNVDAEQFGIEAFFNYNFYKNLYFKTDIAYTSAFNKTFEEHLPLIAPLTANISLEYKQRWFWVNGQTKLIAKQNQYAKTFKETATPGYYIINLRAGFTPTKNISIGASALNLLNKSYYAHTNFAYRNAEKNKGRVYEPGRSFSLFVKYVF